MQHTIPTQKPFVSQPTWLTILRVVLGVILVWKGINFIRDTAELKTMIEQTNIGVFSQSSEALASVVSYLSLLCGFFITVGLFTRIASIIQIPILIVALVFINSRNIEDNTSGLVLTIIVLVLLVLFAVKGSGTLSADEYFRSGAELDRNKAK